MASRRFPGGAFKSAKRAAISSCLNFRRATAAMLTNRLTRTPFESASVSEHLKLLIIAHSNAVRDVVKRDYDDFDLCDLLSMTRERSKDVQRS